MIRHIKRWLAPPVFLDDEIKTLQANLLNSSLTNILMLVPILLIGDLLGGKSSFPSFAAEVLAFAFCLVLRSWMHRGRVRMAKIGLITMALVLITAVVASLGTIRAPTTAMYLLVVISGGLLFDLRGMMITTALCSLLVGGLIGAENAGLLPSPNYSVTITQWVAYIVIFAWAGNLTFSSIQVMNQALTRADKEITERKRMEENIIKSLQEKEVLLKEIHHRVKNNMQIISSLLGLASGTIKERKYKELFRDSQNRINSMSLIHEKLYRSENLTNIDFNEYIRDLANVLFQSRGVTGKIELTLNIEKISIGIDHAIPCGLIINELITNSIKYAFPDDRKGEIKVSLRLNDENMIELVVSDNGVGIPEDVDFRNSESLGLRLVTKLAEDQLHGKIDLDRSNGTEFNIKFDVG